MPRQMPPIKRIYLKQKPKESRLSYLRTEGALLVHRPFDYMIIVHALGL